MPAVCPILRKFCLAPFLFLLLLASCQTEPARKAEKVSWLQEQPIPIRSINPEDTLFSDLIFLKEELKGVELIGLGEQSHGDGSAFLAKARLIKFLHQEMGFSVLAFESGMLDCALAVKALEHGITIDSAFRMGLFKIWSNSQEVAAVRQYAGLQLGEESIPFVGFDSQLSGNLPRAVRVDSIYQVLRRYAPGFDSTYFSTVWKALQPDSPRAFRSWKRDSVFQQEFFIQLDSLARLAGQLQPSTLEDKLFLKGVVSLKPYYYFLLKMDLNDPDNTVLNIRDSVMAEHVAWLNEELFPGRKIILWAANTHLGYERGKLKYPDKMHPMGSYLKERYGEKYYLLSFTTFTGENSSLQYGIRKVPDSSNKTLEYLWAETGMPFAYLRKASLDAIPFEHPFQARLYGYANWYADWDKMTDGIFFIREMKPSHIEE
ncbi:MAG: erythromycin esterase family protein [Phaeodactylibacter sp.]|nr:erythromycin esterase family protein [Phaeodactylibacter sp.]